MRFSRLALARAKATRALGKLLLDSDKLRPLIGKGRSAPVEGRIVDPHLAAMLALDDLMNASDLRKKTPEGARAQLAESVYAVAEEVSGDVTTRDMRVKGGKGVIDARAYTPKGLAAPSPGVVFYHGGGFVTGDLDTHDSFCRKLALLGDVRVVAVDYRLAPEHRFPAQTDDGIAAFRDIASRAAELGIDPAKMAVMGDSAGGNLSAAVSQATSKDAIKPALQILLYPAVDATCSHRSQSVYADGWMLTKGMIDWYYNHYLGEDPKTRRDPRASPLLAESFSGLPPALVYTAAFDPLNDEGAAYVEALQKAGVPAKHVCLEDMIHGFILMGGVVPAAREATAALILESTRILREGFPATRREAASASL